MGRLTLNILLSFAQFEREVTSERIRDKSRVKTWRSFTARLVVGSSPTSSTTQSRILEIIAIGPRGRPKCFIRGSLTPLMIVLSGICYCLAYLFLYFSVEERVVEIMRFRRSRIMKDDFRRRGT